MYSNILPSLKYQRKNENIFILANNNEKCSISINICVYIFLHGTDVKIKSTYKLKFEIYWIIEMWAKYSFLR